MFKKILGMRKSRTVEKWRSKGCIIGEGVHIFQTADLGSEPYLITIGNNVRINEGVKLITHDGGVWVLRNLNKKYIDIDIIKKISIGDNCHIGTNAIIMPGVKIGNNCIIGCGAVVTRDIPNNSIVAGVPARVIETLEQYEAKHREEFIHTKLMNSEEKKKYLINHIK